MMVRCLCVLLGVLAVTAACGPPTPAVDSEISRAFRELEEPSDDDDDPGPWPLDDEDAALVVQAEALQAAVAPDDFELSSHAADLTRRLLAAARRHVGGDLAATSVGGLDVAALSLAERRAIAREAAILIRETGERYALAHAEAATMRHLRAEAELRVLRGDLERALGSRAGLPKDPLALASPRELGRARAALAPLRRHLAENVALFDTPETRAALRSVEQQIERLERVTRSAGYRDFQARKTRLFGGLDRDAWQALRGDHQARTDVELRRLREVAEANSPELRQTLRYSRSVRGPPGRLSSVISSAIREYDVEIRRWSHAEARLRALSEGFTALPARELPSDSPLRDADWRRASLALESDVALHQHRRFLRLALRDASRGTSPEPTPVRERYRHRKAWLEAVEAEIERRGGGRGRVDPASHLEVRKLVGEHLRGRGDPLSPVARQRLQTVLEARFGNGSHLPLALRNDLRPMVAHTVETYHSRLRTLISELNRCNDVLARSRTAVGSEVIAAHQRVRGRLLEAVDGLDRYLTRAEAHGLIQPGSPARKQQVAARMLLHSRTPSPGRSDLGGRGLGSASAARPPPPIPGTTDAAIEKSMVRAERELSELRPQIARLDTAPSRFAADRGRRTLGLDRLRQGPVAWNELTPDRSETRLPRRLAGWSGVVDENGRPFDYRGQVKNLESFQAVGGGVHLGEIAVLRSPPAVRLVLRYSRSDRRLELLGSDGTSYFLDTVEPDVLKALYRFVASGRNAAISLGWSGEPTSRLTGQPRSAREESQPILLDSHFVDTRVGQDLVLVEAIPMRLDQPTLPNGAANPIHPAFRDAVRQAEQQRAARFEDLFAEVEPFRREQALGWATRMSDELIFSPFIQALLLSATRAGGESRLLELMPYLDGSVSPPVDREAPELADDLRKVFSDFRELPEDAAEALREMVEDVVPRLLDAGRCDRAYLELWAALRLAGETSGKAVTRELLGEFIHWLLGPTELAVLMDDRAEVELRNGRIVLAGTLVYRFAVRGVVVGPRGVALLEDGEDGAVEHLSELSRRASAAVPEIGRRYPALARVARYARLAAFLRWARSADALDGIDLSELAAIPAHHPEHFPTPDAFRG